MVAGKLFESKKYTLMHSLKNIGFLALFLILSSAIVHASDHLKLGVIAALPQELKSVKDQLKSLNVEFSHGQSFIHGKFEDVPVVVTLSGMGISFFCD